jgi:hypothetical protein
MEIHGRTSRCNPGADIDDGRSGENVDRDAHESNSSTLSVASLCRGCLQRTDASSKPARRRSETEGRVPEAHPASP